MGERSSLSADPPGRLAFDILDSTNEEARRRARAGEPGPIWISTRLQSAGKGRRGRRWRSGVRDLTATLLLRPSAFRSGATPTEIATLSFATGLAVADMVDAIAGPAPPDRLGLKWPNDVLLDDRKVAGILLESEGAGATAWLAIGVGVNVMSAPRAEHVEVGATPTICLADVAPDRDIAVEAVFEALANGMARWIDVWARSGFSGLRGPWMARAARFGETVVARLPREEIHGRFVDVDPSGALVLDTKSGLRRIAAADIFFP